MWTPEFFEGDIGVPGCGRDVETAVDFSPKCITWSWES